MPNRDVVLLETVRTHRARLVAALLFGELSERRVANDNLRRLIGGIVLAAVACVGCVGFSFVASLRADQAAAKREQAALGPATGPAYAADTFDRRLGRGWGAAERGGPWTVTGPRDLRVSSGAGVLALPKGKERGGYLAAALSDRADVTATLQRRAGHRSGTVTVDVLARRVSRTQDYRAEVQLRPDGTVALTLVRHSDPDRPGEPPQADLSDTVILQNTGTSADAPEGAVLSVRMQALGAGPTTLRAKVWPATGTEPTGWTVTASDSTSGLQRPGAVAVSALRTTGGARSDLAVLDLVARTGP